MERLNNTFYSIDFGQQPSGGRSRSSSLANPYVNKRMNSSPSNLQHQVTANANRNSHLSNKPQRAANNISPSQSRNRGRSTVTQPKAKLSVSSPSVDSPSKFSRYSFNPEEIDHINPFAPLKELPRSPTSSVKIVGNPQVTQVVEKTVEELDSGPGLIVQIDMSPSKVRNSLPATFTPKTPLSPIRPLVIEQELFSSKLEIEEAMAPDESNANNLSASASPRDLEQTNTVEVKPAEDEVIKPSLPEKQFESATDQSNKENIVNSSQTTFEPLETGLMVMKYGRRGKPHRRFVNITKDQSKICWREFVEAKKGESMPLSEVTHMTKGCSTAVFARYPKKEKKRKSGPNEDCCLSLISNKRTLDLEFGTSELRDQWYHLLQALIRSR